MIKLLRSSLRCFSSEKLKTLHQKYKSNPTEAKAAFYYIRQLLRENQNALARQEIMSLPSEMVYHPEIQKLNDVLNRRNNAAPFKDSSRRQTANVFHNMVYMLALGSAAYLVYDWFANPAQKIGKSENIKKKLQKKKKAEEAETKFDDIRGIDEFRQELMEVVDYIKFPDKYRKAGAKLPKGILMVGPPGTGKTMMARALANQAGCKFIYRSGSEFDEVFVGVGASRVRDLFAEARKEAPAIIFIDELDSVAGRRNQIVPHANDTINQLLTEMDGFKESENIIVIGATNMESAIDPAIKRPGRFDKIINVPLPDIKGREDIFKLYLGKIQFKDVNSQLLARMTFGFSGADIQNMVNIAILNCAKQARASASRKDFEFAYDRIVMGIGRTKLFVTEKDKLITAYHECGHTIIALLTEGATPLHKVTMLPRGGALGFTSMVPQTDNLSQTKKQILAMIDVCFGGKVAEQIIMGNEQVTSGSSNDLQKATNLAYSYVKQLGMTEKSLICQVQGLKVSDGYSSILDKQVEKILQESYQRVKKQLLSRKDQLSLLAMQLMRKETMTAEQVKKCLHL